MNQAMHRMQNSAAHGARPLSFSAPSQPLGWALPANNRAVVAQVLSQALEFVNAGAAGSNINPPTLADHGFDAAVRLYERGHWEQAFVDLAALADHGHAPAAKLALLMLRYGAAVYASTFTVHPGQVARWAQRVLRASPRVASRATASPSSSTAIA